MFSKIRILLLLLLLLSAVSPARTRVHPAATSRKPHLTKAVAKKSPVQKAHIRTVAYRRHHSKHHSAHRHKALSKAERKKAKRMAKAFVASADLKPMARQLVADRSPAAYNAVEDYARRHAGKDAGGLAWLALGYAHTLDQHHDQAIAALEKARPRTEDLKDYIVYLEALSYAGKGDDARVIDLLRDFDQRMPESIFQKEVVPIYGNALAALGRTQEAIAYLEAHRQPVRASIELALGKSYLKSERPEKGMEVLKHLYFTMPLSPEADDAAALLAAAGSALEGSYADQKTRADLLAGAGRYAEAERAYRDLAARTPTSEQDDVEIALASMMRRSNPAGARSILERSEAQGEANAQRLYLLCEIARNDDNESALDANLERMRQESPASQWLAQALLAAGNFYLLRKEYDRAQPLYAELSRRFPSNGRASYAHWKSAWLIYRQGRKEEARQAFENQVALYPDRSEAPAALYWRARIAEDEHDYATARAWYTVLAYRFRYYYYGCLGRERLAALPAETGARTAGSVTGTSATPVDFAPGRTVAAKDPVLALIPEVKAPGPEALEVEPPPDELSAEKSQLLVNAGLYDFAIRELQAEQGGQGASWATLQIARIYRDSGQDHRALQFLKRSLPGYYSVEFSSLPREYWEILFPRPYWDQLLRQARANELDPYLVASLIRQESEFNPGAVSRANAYGLMQLLPSVGRGEARAARMRNFSTSSLLVPNVNIQLGTHYFKEMVTQFNGQVEYALAAYNAGSNRVDEWLQNGKYGEIAEFVESIPFTETREYVQAIVRNSQVYRQLYLQTEACVPGKPVHPSTPTTGAREAPMQAQLCPTAAR
jgi:peptidoglycan lytic transglycosylase